MEEMQSKFSFWCPIEKSHKTAIDPTTGEQKMVLGGIASTSDKDADGEFLDPNGFDIAPLLTSGMVNWHHQAKNTPSTIIGEPIKAEIRKEGLYIETELYASSPVARDVWELANTLEKNSKTRRLGYSIEGKVVKRKSEDKSSPDYNYIDKAVITGVAITHMPKNPRTFANIIKGEIDDDYVAEYEEEEVEIKKEKALDTENGAPLKKESLLGANKFLTKGETLDKIFRDMPGISISKAEKIYQLINNIAMAKERKQVSEEDISKAYETLGFEKPIDIAKGVEEAPEEEVDETAEEEVVEEPIKKGVETAEEEAEEQESEENDEDDEEKSVKKGGMNRFDIIEKAIQDSNSSNIQFFKAIGTLIKDNSQALEKANTELSLSNGRIQELEELVKAQADTISELSDSVERLGGQPIRKAAVSTRHFERNFEKGGNGNHPLEEPEESKYRQVSATMQKGTVQEILDEVAFKNGFDEEFSKGLMEFEASGNIPSNVLNRLKREYGIEITK